MGLSFSCPLADSGDLENKFESVIVKSITFGDNGAKTPVRSVSFKGQDVEPTILQSVGSGKMVVEGSVSFRTKENEPMNSPKAPSPEDETVLITSNSAEIKEIDTQLLRHDSMSKRILQSPILDSSNPKHEAAIKLQKVYKSFRTRRKLADCAVLIEQSWWKLLDFAELKHSSISFFDLDKHETAISRWSRARTRAAKVGKGLSKNGKAQKLALQHWLEAIDPRHRYGHNLHFYYVKWLHSQSKEPFFYWLDIGEGREVNLVEKCPRAKLQQQCIKYLGPMERMNYEVVVEDGRLLYKQREELLDTTGELKGSKWIFVLSTSGTLYVGKKKKGTFQHSSFLAGGATLAAGRIVVESGILKAVWPHSGHYRPTPENFQDFISFLRENNVDLTNVQMDSLDEEESIGKQSINHSRNNSSEEDLADKDGIMTEEIDAEDLNVEISNATEEEPSAALEARISRQFGSFNRKLTSLEIPDKDDLLDSLESENRAVESSSKSFVLESPLEGYETAEESFVSERSYESEQQNISDDQSVEMVEETIPDESILQRINSHKGMKSFQLGKQLSCKWSTGAGPRIGCVRDYPSELQSHALEQVSLSPRSARCLRSNFSSRVSTPTSFSGELQVATSPPLEKDTLSRRGSCHARTQLSPLYRGNLEPAMNKRS
ncbi:hypothetical protein RJ639_040469 [Escallonia herrerae]|uniref:IQ domain-containing protein IQM2-like n=1 Tax=Escallonia herrerae TaxID=1293975 RepID=A0AA88WIP2_9ASTE|nr:hypothetical protein RJ639_040469 [Escallonia herrerae]